MKGTSKLAESQVTNELSPFFSSLYYSLIEWKEIMKNLLVVSAAVSCALLNTGCTPKLGGNDYSVKGAALLCNAGMV